MHGIAGEGPATTPKALAAIGIEASADPDAAARRLEADNIAYLPLEHFCPQLLRLFALRPVLGLRSPANTFARMLNPFGARHQMQGVFHPNYLATHQAAAQRLDQPFLAAFKGGGGEVQRNPEKPCRVVTLDEGVPGGRTGPRSRRMRAIRGGTSRRTPRGCATFGPARGRRRRRSLPSSARRRSRSTCSARRRR